MLRQLAALAAVTVIFVICAGKARAGDSCAAPPPSLSKFQPAKERAALPTLPFDDGSGRDRSLAEFRGKGAVINFWATWCAPCVREMPALDRLAASAPGVGDGFSVIALSADREGAAVVRRFYDANGIRNLAVAVDKQNRVSRSLGVFGLPTTVLFDRDGREAGRVLGIVEWDAPEVVAFLRRCLAPPV
jgi:thiol-disulfide isomerase/thioredoxin